MRHQDGDVGLCAQHRGMGRLIFYEYNGHRRGRMGNSAGHQPGCQAIASHCGRAIRRKSKRCAPRAAISVICRIFRCLTTRTERGFFAALAAAEMAIIAVPTAALRSTLQQIAALPDRFPAASRQVLAWCGHARVSRLRPRYCRTRWSPKCCRGHSVAACCPGPVSRRKSRAGCPPR